MGSEAVRGGPIAGVLFVFGRGADDGPGDDIARGGEILGDFVGADGCGNVLGDTVVTIIGAVGLFQEDEGFAVIRAGTVEFQAGEFGLEVEGVANGQGGKAKENGARGGAEQGEAGEKFC